MAVVVAVLGSALAVTMTAQQKAESRDMTLLGSNDLQARSAYQPIIQKQGDRYIAYIGHHQGSMPNVLTGKFEDNGTSVVDVTNPRQPKYIAHIPGGGEAQGGGQAQMVRACSGLPKADRNKTFILRSFGSIGHEVWDVTVPEKPVKVTTVVDNLKETHKSWWECETGIAYLVGGDPAWRTARMTKIYDLSDPAKPVFVRDFGLPGQQPGASGDVPVGLHGPMSTGPKGNRVYFGYGTNKDGVMQIVDRQKLLNGPKEPTTENLLYPQVGRLDLPPNAGAHTAFPLLGVTVGEFARDKDGRTRDFVVVTNEAIANECLEARQMVWIADITTESKPFGVASWTVRESSGDFCGRGGRFGTHSSNENMTSIYYKRVMFFAHFNAGVRAVDVRDPYHPKEIGSYVPAITAKTDKRCVGTGADERCKTAIQTNNVDVDDRGYIYIVDRANTGLHILELTGAARAIADFRLQSSE